MPSNSTSRLTRHPYGLLALVLIAAAAIVTAIALLSRERIDINERAWFVARLDALVPPSMRDNDLYADRIIVSQPDTLGNNIPITIFRARHLGRPSAAILTANATDGYGGTIELLVAVDYAGNVLNVDVTRHNETQGIGDGFAHHRSNWLGSLKGRALGDPVGVRWTIRKDGGAFDQFTGASITPRAILKAVRRTLEYYSTRRDRIFDAPSVESGAALTVNVSTGAVPR